MTDDADLDRRATVVTLAILLVLDAIISVLFIANEHGIVVGLGMFFLAGGPFTLLLWGRTRRTVRAALSSGLG